MRAVIQAGYFENIKIEEEKKKNGSRKDDIEKSIRKKFHKQLFSKFAKTINTYELVKEHDKIAVCISGGKDSMLMAKLFRSLNDTINLNLNSYFLDGPWIQRSKQKSNRRITQSLWIYP